MRAIDTALKVEPRGAGFGRIFRWIARRSEIRRTRIDLLDLSDHQLRDIGLKPEQAMDEGRLPWWR
jgi:uncharacterized protein YjiS (DUF1127 family)